MAHNQSRRGITRREFMHGLVSGLGSLGFGSLLAACGISAGTPTETVAEQVPVATVPAQTTIEVWYYDGGLGETTRAFERAHPEIKVNLRQYGDIEAGLVRALASGNGLPDATVFSNAATARLAESGGMADLAAAPFDGAALKNDMVASAWSNAQSREGRLNGLPLSIYPGSYWYRADLLDAAGIDSDPAKLQEQLTTWEALFTLAQEFRSKVPTAAMLTGVAFDVFYPQILQQGGGWVDGDKLLIEEKATLPAGQAALARRLQLDANLPPGQSSWDDAMRKGAIVGLFAPAWFQGYISNIYFNMIGKWRSIRAPGGDFMQGAQYLGIPAASTKQELAWQFVRFCCANTEGQNTFLKTSGDFPAYMPAWNDPFYDQAVGFFGDQHTYRLWADIAANAPALAPSRHDNQIFEIVELELRRMLEEDKEPAQAMKDAEAAVIKEIPGLQP